MHTLRANTVGSAVSLLLITPSHMFVENSSFKNDVSQLETTFILN